MSAELLPFRRHGSGWSNEERALLVRVERLLAEAGLSVETEYGETEEGDPWCVFCHADGGDVVVHVARIDDVYVLDSPVIAGSITGRSLTDCADRFLERARLVGQPARAGTTFWIHPTAMLAGVLMTIVVFSLTMRERAPEERNTHDDAPAAPLAEASAEDAVGPPTETDAELREDKPAPAVAARARQAAQQIAAMLAADRPGERTGDGTPGPSPTQWALLHSTALIAALALEGETTAAEAEATLAEPRREATGPRTGTPAAPVAETGEATRADTDAWRTEALATATTGGGGRIAARPRAPEPTLADETAVDAAAPSLSTAVLADPTDAETRTTFIERRDVSTASPPAAIETAQNDRSTLEAEATARESLDALIGIDPTRTDAAVALSEALESLLASLVSGAVTLTPTEPSVEALAGALRESDPADPVEATPAPTPEPGAARDAERDMAPDRASSAPPGGEPTPPTAGREIAGPAMPPATPDPAPRGPIWETFAEVSETSFDLLIAALAEFGTVDVIDGDVLYFYDWFDARESGAMPTVGDLVAVGHRHDDGSAEILIALAGDVPAWLT